jgi:hypothetical protein
MSTFQESRRQPKKYTPWQRKKCLLAHTCHRRCKRQASQPPFNKEVHHKIEWKEVRAEKL